MHHRPKRSSLNFETPLSCKKLKISPIPAVPRSSKMNVKLEYIGRSGVAPSLHPLSPFKFRKQPKFKWLPVLRKSLFIPPLPTYGPMKQSGKKERKKKKKNDQRTAYFERKRPSPSGVTSISVCPFDSISMQTREKKERQRNRNWSNFETDNIR